MSSRRRVVITGVGWVTPLGHDLESVWQALLAGQSGIGPTSIFDARTFPTKFSAEIKQFDFQQALGQFAPAHVDAARHVKFALASALQAWKDAGFDAQPPADPDMVGVYLGAGEGPIDFDNFVAAAVCGWDYEKNELSSVKWADTAYERLSCVREFEQDPNIAGARVARLLNASGPNFNTLTACAASNQAIGEATFQIRRGDVDVVVSGGAHSMIHPLGVTGFNRLTALSMRNDSPQTASRPFNRTRDGFVLGEGAGILILEELEHAKNRGARIYAEILGFGSTADAFRITDIHEEARGGAAAMRLALEDAGLQPDDVDYVSAHGTGTQENDSLETLAIRKALGERAKHVPVSSVKSMLGHLIAAAGAVELITCVLAMRDQTLPPTMNLTDPDPSCDLDYVPNAPRQAKVDVCLSNNFGFGGQNDTLAIRRYVG